MYIAGDFDQAHLYLQWGGSLPGNDEWSCGMRLRTVGNPAQLAFGATQAIAGCADRLTIFHQNSLSHISPRAKLSYVKLNMIGVDGKYALETTNEFIVADLPGAGDPDKTPPNQVALVATLQTGFSRGPAHAGRFYMPLPTMLLGADGLVTEAYRDDVATQVNTLIAGLNTVDPDFHVAVFSRKAGAPAMRVVTGAVVGRVLDTQRRRRNKLIESY